MDSTHKTMENATSPETQCQAMLRTGQCPKRGVEYRLPNGEVAYHKYCPAHGGSSFTKNQKEEALNNYRINKFQARLREMRTASTIKDLRDEIGILRLILEEKLNSFQSSTDMILQSGSIGDLIMKIERLVTSCHKLDEKMGAVVDKAVVVIIAEKLISSVTNNVTDADALEKIADDFSKILEEQYLMKSKD